MIMKILAASVLTLGLGASAMAQNADEGMAGSGVNDGSGKSVVVDPNDPNAVDPNATYSIDGISNPYGTSSTPDQNCSASPQGAQPDASGKSPGTTSPTVNDNHCGK
ncbi:hypothetical protein D3227_19665 [Mesorhizobium waimense]|uniref:Secreted protein n=1 Tax=Mesorhizobium waimense TaxID=1300307 RepID=A0A3A5KP92_9HYPH|nr:hypothetical protein [Mesorhizobium waimense]RJT36331.1 hypothetical protein D3227_19665 [Mesorhizobium waimense]